MTAPVLESNLSATARAQIEAAWDRYHASVAEHSCEGHDPAKCSAADVWDRRVIEQAILAVAREGRLFSVNDFRDLLPEVRTCLISRRLIAAQRAGWIKTVGVTHSTLPSTKAARVSVYQPLKRGLPR